MHEPLEEISVRRWPRCSISVPVKVHTSALSTVPLAGVVKDVSRGGLGIRLPFDLRNGSQVCVEFPSLFDLEPMIVPAVIKNRHNAEISGLELTAGSDDEQRIEECLVKILIAIGDHLEASVENRRGPTEEVHQAILFDRFLSFLEEQLEAS